MKKLTFVEEINILKEIIDNAYEYVGHGSSRAVYLYGDQIVKIALDEGGINQNKREVELFEEHGGEHLAEIYAVGKYIIVMEYIEEMREDAEWLMYRDDFKYIYFKRNNKVCFIKRPVFLNKSDKKILAACNFLTYVNGNSSDSCQVGLSDSGAIKAFDYGYLVGEGDSSIGSISDYGDYENDYAFLEVGIRRLEARLLQEQPQCLKWL